ncbi:hypothetical protein [Ramlibacter sp.]|jgi:hypothetical protein|uniref:hypothetical protein n=1 Tax=Ramlibacter sp. TaxID=1917967 RepID=UPI00260E9F41|nr:hypothetical protein [Ramlibacter sp.]MDB5957304.1 hypothetical protein [Ramlibacter sp.]
MPRLLPASVAAIFAGLATGAQAHPGHGASAFHLHPTDTSGFLMVVVLAGLALWLSREE